MKEQFKKIAEARDQGFVEALKLWQALDEALDEIMVLKKVVRHNSGGDVTHIKVKEADSYDGMKSAKNLGNFLWDME